MYRNLVHIHASFLFLLLFGSANSQAQLIDLEVTCSKAFQTNPRFKFGQVTHANNSAEDFFSSPVTSEGKPRLVMMVGIPGAGKSTWAGHASAEDWTLIQADSIRMKIVGQSHDPQDHFKPSVLEATENAVDEQLKKAVQLGQSIVLDQNNLTPLRARFTEAARNSGYQIEALVFTSEGAEANKNNIKLRSDHAVTGLPNDLVEKRHQQFSFYNQHLLIQTPASLTTEAINLFPSIGPLIALPDRFPTLADAIKSLPQDEKAKLEALLGVDQFHKVEVVWTPDFSALPLDSPVLRERVRLYAALTTKCNRACPWCCVYSNPYKNTFLQPDQLERHFPKDVDFDLQLEGGEPTIHPQLFEFVRRFRAHAHGKGLVLVTNGVMLPKTEPALKEYLLKFGAPLTVKLSVNHHLLEKDKNLITKALMLKKVISDLGPDHRLILNVRLRKGPQFGDDQWVLALVKGANLEGISNIFFLQSYGLASAQADWEPPFTVNGNFLLINPDGTSFTGSLQDRADQMGKLK